MISFFSETGSLFEDVDNWFRLNKIYLDEEMINHYCKRLEKASKRNDSILKELDVILNLEQIKIWEKTRGVNSKKYVNKTGGRDLERENIRRTMRKNLMTESQAIKYMKEKKEKTAAKKPKLKMPKPILEINEKGYGVLHDGKLNMFHTNKLACNFLITLGFYTDEHSARVSFNRNLKHSYIAIQGWAAYFFE